MKRVLTKMAPSIKTPRRLLVFEYRTADSRLDDLSSPVSACARTVGLGFTPGSLPHKGAKKTGSVREFGRVISDRYRFGVKDGCGNTHNSAVSN